MNRIIFGGLGFVGFNLAKHMVEQGHDVIVFDNLVRRGSEFNILLAKKLNIKFIHGDIRNKEDFNKIPEGNYDCAFDCSAQPSACTGYSNPVFDITNNYFGTLNILEYCRTNGLKLIFWSTNKVYCGDKLNSTWELHEQKKRWIHKFGIKSIDESFPIDGGDHSIYGVSKVCSDLTCQEWAKAFDMNIIVNRFSCLAGPGQWGMAEQGWVAWFVIAALFDLPITLYGWHGKQVRDVLFMTDLCRLIDMQIDNFCEQPDGVFNIGGGQYCNISLLECISLIEKLTKRKIRYTITDEIRKADQCVYISDITKAEKIYNWKPKIKMAEGLEQIIKWVKDNQKQLKGLYA